MRLNGKQQAAVLISGFLVIIAGVQLNETVSAVHLWWQGGHPGLGNFVVPHWWTRYTVASALFAPIWIVCACVALLSSRRWPVVALVTLSSFVIIEPLSCVSAPSVD